MDLNLLVTLQALLVEKHISRAAIRLHKSQPAVSHALAHLRTLFDDPLLIRRSGKLELTVRAGELLVPLNDALAQLASLIDPPQFDPACTQRMFRLAMSDYGARVVLPSLVRTVQASAPGVELVVSQASRETMLADVMDGEVDMALGVFPERSVDALRGSILFRETFACLADATTVADDGTMDLATWLARPHVLVTMRSGVDNEIDRALTREGLSRNVTLSLPHWGVATEVIAGTELILTVARRSLDCLETDSRVRVFKPPLGIDPFEFKLIWHQRRESDPAHAWLRQVITRAVNERRPGADH